MSEAYSHHNAAAELDKCRADLYRSKTRLANAQHRIADLEAKLAAAEADAGRLDWLEDPNKCGGWWVTALFRDQRSTHTGCGEGIRTLIDRHMRKQRQELDAAINAARGVE